MRAATAGAVGLSELDRYLRPAPIAGEALRFDLSTYRSTVTREMLQIRLRMTPAAFGTGEELVAANLAGDALEVDAGALEAANAEARRRLAGGPEGAVGYLRALAMAAATLDRLAGSTGRRLAQGTVPPPEAIVAYVLANARHQALGALKFCLPASFRADLLALLEEPGAVDALLAPDGPTLWAQVRAAEVAAARVRAGGPAERYRRRLERHRRHFGYLYAEDVDFREHETLDALDARIASIATTERRRLTEAGAADRARKREARRRFAEGPQDATQVALVLLARALADHEDRNRRAKMRFLRDLRDLATLVGLDVEHDGLEAFTSAGRPVVRSS